MYEQLAERIRGEVPDLDQAVQRSLEAWPRAQRSSDVQRVYLDSVALNLHGLYSALERLFELIARQVDTASPLSRLRGELIAFADFLIELERTDEQE